MLHDVAAGGLHAQRERGQRGGCQVHPQDHDGGERRVPVQGHGGEQHHDLSHVVGHEEGDHLLDVAEHPAALAHGVDDGGEAVVHEDHVGGVLRHVGARDAHGHADVGGFERGRVVHAVARHGAHLAGMLQRAHDAQLVQGRHAGEHRGVAGRLV